MQDDFEKANGLEQKEFPARALIMIEIMELLMMAELSIEPLSKV